MKHTKRTLILIFFVFFCTTADAEWWNSSWHYSFNVTVNATDYDRVEIPVEIDVNFTDLLQNKASGIFDENSVRVIESASSGNLEERESIFYKYTNFNASVNAVGLVVFVMNGTTKNNTIRNFTVYFDIIENGPKNPVSYNFSNGKGLWGDYSNGTRRFDEVINLIYSLAPGAFLEVTWKGWINTTTGNFSFTVENILTGIYCGSEYSRRATLNIDNATILSSSDICNKNISNTQVLDKGLHNITFSVYTKNDNPWISANVTIRLKWNASGITEIIPKINLYGDMWTSPVSVIKGNVTVLYSGIVNFPVSGFDFSRGDNISISVNITFANATTKNITCALINSSNATNFVRNLVNSTSLLLGEWHSTENCSLNLSHSLGQWRVVCNASDVNNYTASFENLFNVKSYKPVLINVTYKNSSAWGAEYNISVNALDPDSNVTVTLWMCGNGSCNNYGSKTGNLLNWSVNFSCADVGNLSFKFEYNDSDHAPVNTTEYNFSLIPDSVSLTVTKRPASLIVNRSEIINISINFYDTDKKKYISNSNGTIYVNQTSQNCFSDLNGNCSALFNTSFWRVGNYSFFGGIFDSCYIQSNTSNETFLLYGNLTASIVSPVNGSTLYKNWSYVFNSTIIDDNGTIVHPQVTWSDSYGLLNNSENFVWRVPLNYSRGQDLIILNVTSPPFYYNISPVNVSVKIYGYSKVEIISPLRNISYNGTPIEFKCRVSDLNGSGIEVYPVGLLITDGSGSTIYSVSKDTIAGGVVTADPFLPNSTGNYTFKCTIRDKEDSYYHAFINNASSTIKISGNISVENVSADKFVDMNYGILNLTASIKGIFVSNVWARFWGENESVYKDLTSVSGTCVSNYSTCIYTTTFTPSNKSFYNVTIFVNDTSNNTIINNYTNLFYSSYNTSAVLTPKPANISILLSEGFSVNITLNNTGNATMLGFNLTIQVPYGFSAIPNNFTGDLSMNHSQIFVFNISSNESLYEPVNILNFTVAWKNPDNSLNSAKTNISVSVSFPPTLRLDKHYISDAMIDGTSKIIGNFTILSLGNESIEGIVCSIKDGNIDNSWLSYIPSNTFLAIQPNKNETVMLNISIPKGTYAGVYTSNITCNATFSNCVNSERCFDRLLLNITVSGNGTWEVQSSFNYTVAAGTASNLSLPVTNKGNIDMHFVYLIANKSLTNASIALYSNEIYVAKGTTGNILLEFSSTGTGISYINLTIKNMNTGEIINIEIKINATDFPPVIEDASVYPADLYVGNAVITANVYDNDKCGVDKVWVNITKPNSSVYIGYMSNISNFYILTYQPDQVGQYKILIYANDTCGMLNKSPEISFTYSVDINALLIEINQTLANYSSQNYSYYSSLLREINSTMETYKIILSQISSNTSNISKIMDYVSNVNSTIEKLSQALSQLDALFDRSWNIRPETLSIHARPGDYGYINLTIQNTGLFDFTFNISLSGNATLFSSAPSSIFVPRKDSAVLPVFYSIGNISDGIYTLNVSVSNANSTPSERKIYIYFNVSQYVPLIKEFLISATPVSIGSPEIITVSIYDSMAVEDVWIQLNSIVVNYTLKSNDSWIFVLNTSNLSVGDNDFTVFARDFNGNIKNKSAWFEIYDRKIFFAGESTALIHFNFYRPGTESKENLILNFSNTGREYNKTITARNYDIVFNVFGNTIKIFNARLNQSFYNPIKFYDVSLGDVSIGDTTSVLRVININASDDFRNAFSNGVITLNYGLRTVDIEKQVRIYRCSEFDITTKKCSGNWNIIENSTIDFEKHTVSAPFTGFSAYAAARAIICGDGLCDSVYGERCEKCSIDCGSCPPTPSGGGGGIVSGGGGTSVDVTPILRELQALKESVKNISPSILESVSNYTNITQAFVSPIKVETDGLDIALSAGERKSYLIKLFNELNTNLTAFVSLTGELIRFIEVDDKVMLNPKSYSTLKFTAYASNVSEGKDYYGELKITSESYNKSIPIHVSVSVNDPILEPKISIATEEIQPDGTIRFNVLLSNVGYKKKFDVEVFYRVRDSENKIIKEEKEIISMEDYASFERNFSFKEASLSPGQYVIEVESNYLNKKVSRIATFRVPVPYSVYFLVMLIIVLLAGLVFALYRLRKYLRAKELEKLKYAVPVNVKKLPVGDIWLGNISEKNIKAFFDMDDLTTHMIIAGSTGSGKTVTAMGIIESVLLKGIPVVVFDPTAQWTGFLRPNKDEKMFKYYPKFGLKREDARSFKGMIYEVTSSDIQLDLRKYMNPMEVSVFTLNKVPPEEYSRAVENIVKSIFAIPWEESSSLKMVVVFDEVHRLVKKFGEEEGYLSLEKGCREFRKWGIGLIMVSQVLSDFKEQIKGNILTEIQLHTKSLGDIGRVAEKYGADYSRSVTLMEVGTGMIQNPKYNDGKPWFVDFKPLVSSPHKLAESEILEYKKFDTILKDIESEIEFLRTQGLDVSDLELELKLARNKLKEAKFRMIEIYVDSLRSSLKKKQK